MNANRWTGVGRLTRDPELKLYKKKDGTDGYRCWFPLAITRLMDRGEKDASKRRVNYITIVTWGAAAQRHAQFLAKGTEVMVSGELICEGKKQPDGTYKNYTSVIADEIQYGRRSTKNASRDQLVAEANALQARINAFGAGTSAAPAAAPAAAGATPFDDASAPADPFAAGSAA